MHGAAEKMKMAQIDRQTNQPTDGPEGSHQIVWNQEIMGCFQDILYVMMNKQDVKEKLCFFPCCKPSPKCRTTYPRKRWVYSCSFRLAILCTTNSKPVLQWVRSQNISNSWKKNTVFPQHPVEAKNMYKHSLCGSTFLTSFLTLSHIFLLCPTNNVSMVP